MIANEPRVDQLRLQEFPHQLVQKPSCRLRGTALHVVLLAELGQGLVSRASSKPLQHTHEHQRPDIKDRFLKQCTDSRSLVLGVLLKSPAGYSANLSVQRNGTKCMVHISAKARRALWLVRPWDILVLSASCRPLQDTDKGIRHCAEHQRATMHATSWFSKAQHSWDPAGGAARA